MKKRLIISIAVGIVISVILASFGVFAKDCSSIREKVLRLHILANSNDTADQALKLKVRDRILTESKSIFATGDKQKAETEIDSNMKKIEDIANDEIRKQGYTYKARAERVNMFFTTRDYGNITMPAGKYDALRITIGEAIGQNWWCVLYPPICLPSSQPKEQLDDVLTSSETDIVQNKSKYEVRFALLEFFEKLFS